MDLDLGDTRLIISIAQRQGALRNQLAAILGNAYWETARTMEPVRETLATSDAQAISRLDHWWATKKPSWVTSPYWRENYFGRGYVQLTHKRNYQRAGQRLGVDLVGTPSLALDPNIAAEILVRGSLEGWFTGKRISDYVTLKRSDYVGARRVINGTNKAQAIAELCRDYEVALLADGYGVEATPPVVNERRDGTTPRRSQLQSSTQVSASLAALTLITGQVEQLRSLVAPIAATLGVSAETLLTIVTLICLGYIAIERRRKWKAGDR